MWYPVLIPSLALFSLSFCASKGKELYPADTVPLRASYNFLVSGYNSQIAFYSYNDGLLNRTETLNVDPNLLWLEQVGESFYAIHDVNDFEGVQGGALSRWEQFNGGFYKREYVSLQSPGPAHLLVDTDHNLVYTANYGGASVTVVSSAADGSLGDVVQVIKYGEGCRDVSHPHHVARSGDLVWIVDLGCDAVYHYKVDDGQLIKVGETAVEAGAGPRHMVVDEEREMVYLACELKNFVQFYFADLNSGELTLVTQLPIAPSDGSFAAEILMSADKKVLYVSTRGEGIIAAYNLPSQDGEITKIQEFRVAGTWPRGVALRDNLMVAADQKGKSLQLIAVDPFNGLLSDLGSHETPSDPGFVLFYD